MRVGTKANSGLYLQVMAGICLGALVGAFFPKTGVALKPVGDLFIALIKMMIGPVIFCTVVNGLGSMRDTAKVGRIGLKALVYFEIVSTFALGLGLLAAHLFRPGSAIALAQAPLPRQAPAVVVPDTGLFKQIAHIVPDTIVSAFTSGDLLQVLLISVLIGLAVGQMGTAGDRIGHAVDIAGKLLFRVIGIIVRFAPIGAFGAMAFTVGQYGIKALLSLGSLVATFYGTSALFILVVLGTIARLAGFSILRLIAYLREELLIVLGTSSSEPALPGLLLKMERLGASPTVVGLVVPTGYSFNLDGTNIYMTLSVLFLAQATGTHLSFQQEMLILVVAMITSKGASGVTGAGFATLAATLSVASDIPIASLGMLLGIDRLMSQCRSLTNFIGNGVATLIVAGWEKELDRDVLSRELARGAAVSADYEAPVTAAS